MKFFPYIILALLFGAVIVFGGPVFEAKTSLLGNTAQFINNLGGSALHEEAARLRLENESLKAKLLAAQINPYTDYGDYDYLKAKVYSDYPFNNKSELAVAAGSDLGVKIGMPVTVGESILVGRVIEVSPSVSLVSTVFDPRLELSVRIGFREIDALFQGGAEPSLDLIQRDAGVHEKEIVFSASPEIPYGLEIGRIEKLLETTGGPFKEGVVQPPYSLGELREISIITNYGTNR